MKKQASRDEQLFSRTRETSQVDFYYCYAKKNLKTSKPMLALRHDGYR